MACQRGKQGDRFKPRDLGIAAFDPAAKGNRQTIGQKIGVKQTALGLFGKLDVEWQACRPIGGLIGVAPCGDMLATIRKESAKANFAGHVSAPDNRGLACGMQGPTGFQGLEVLFGGEGRFGGQVRGELGHGAVKPFQQRRRRRLARGEIRRACVNASGQRCGLEKAKQRAQLMFDHQRMPIPAARGQQQDWLACKGGGFQQVDQMLEQSRIAALMDGAGDDQRIGR